MQSASFLLLLFFFHFVLWQFLLAARLIQTDDHKVHHITRMHHLVMYYVWIWFVGSCFRDVLIYECLAITLPALIYSDVYCLPECTYSYDCFLQSILFFPFFLSFQYLYVYIMLHASFCICMHKFMFVEFCTFSWAYFEKAWCLFLACCRLDTCANLNSTSLPWTKPAFSEWPIECNF